MARLKNSDWITATLYECRVTLVNRLRDTDTIIDILIGSDAITQECKEQVKDKPREEKVRDILDGISGSQALEHLIEALKRTDQDELADFLRKKLNENFRSFLKQGNVNFYHGNVLRPEKVEAIRGKLQSLSQETNRTRILWINDIPGSGKTWLVAAAVNDVQFIEQCFQDGVIWINLTNVRDLTERSRTRYIEDLFLNLLKHPFVNSTKHPKKSDHSVYSEHSDPKNAAMELKRNLKKLLENYSTPMKLLIILDDVWDKEIIDAFDGLDVCLLVTSSLENTSLKSKQAKTEYINNVKCDINESITILQQYSGIRVGTLSDSTIMPVIQICHNIPLTVKIVGCLLRAKTEDQSAEILAIIRDEISSHFRENRSLKVVDLMQILMDVSIELLDEELNVNELNCWNFRGTLSDKYKDIAPSKNRECISADMMARMWGTERQQAQELLREFSDRGWLDSCEGSFLIHEIQQEVIRKMNDKDGSHDRRHEKWIDFHVSQTTPGCNDIVECFEEQTRSSAKHSKGSPQLNTNEILSIFIIGLAILGLAKGSILVEVALAKVLPESLANVSFPFLAALYVFAVWMDMVSLRGMPRFVWFFALSVIVVDTSSVLLQEIAVTMYKMDLLEFPLHIFLLLLLLFYLKIPLFINGLVGLQRSRGLCKGDFLVFVALSANDFALISTIASKTVILSGVVVLFVVITAIILVIRLKKRFILFLFIFGIVLAVYLGQAVLEHNILDSLLDGVTGYVAILFFPLVFMIGKILFYLTYLYIATFVPLSLGIHVNLFDENKDFNKFFSISIIILTGLMVTIVEIRPSHMTVLDFIFVYLSYVLFRQVETMIVTYEIESAQRTIVTAVVSEAMLAASVSYALNLQKRASVKLSNLQGFSFSLPVWLASIIESLSSWIPAKSSETTASNSIPILSPDVVFIVVVLTVVGAAYYLVFRCQGIFPEKTNTSVIEMIALMAMPVAVIVSDWTTFITIGVSLITLDLTLIAMNNAIDQAPKCKTIPILPNQMDSILNLYEELNIKSPDRCSKLQTKLIASWPQALDCHLKKLTHRRSSSMPSMNYMIHNVRLCFSSSQKIPECNYEEFICFLKNKGTVRQFWQFLCILQIHGYHDVVKDVLDEYRQISSELHRQNNSGRKSNRNAWSSVAIDIGI